MTSSTAAWVAFGILAAYSAIMLAINAKYITFNNVTKSKFMLVDRQLPWWITGPSIASAWIWVTALFVGPQQAFVNGWVGLFWFSFANILTMAIFAWFISTVRDSFPTGYTGADYMRRQYSTRVQNLYLIQMLGLSICVFATQLLAGAVLLSNLTGLSFFSVTVGLTLCSLCYSTLSGLRAGVLNTLVKLVVIYGTLLIGVPWAVSNAGGWHVVVDGLGGASGQATSLFEGKGASVFWSFGLSASIGLLAGPFGDQTYWQRGFATKSGDVVKAFVTGAALYAIVPILLGVLGLVAAGAHLKVPDPQIVNMATVTTYLPTGLVIAFLFMLMIGIVSTLDSSLDAMASLSGHDIFNKIQDRFADKEAYPLFFARSSMIILAILALMVANIPGMKLVYLFLFYGTLRAAVVIPTVMTILADKNGRQLSEAGVFWGIVAAAVIGVPVFSYGNFGGPTDLIWIGSLLTLGISGSVVWLTSQKTATQKIA